MTTVTSRSTTDRGAGNGPRLVHIAPVVPIFMVALLASRVIADNSFLWHVRAGEVQAATGQVLRSDPFSFTELATPWRTQSWLAELLYAWLESTFGGLAWANWMVFVVATATVGLLGIAVHRATPSPVTTGLVLVVSAWLIGPFIQPRPVVFSYLLMAALVVALERRDRLAWAIAPILWLWAAVHGSWILGGLLVFLWWLRTWDRRVFVAGLAGGAMTLFTAHGWGTWQIVVEFLGTRETLAQMAEWAPPDFANIVQAPYLLVVAGLLVAGVKGKLGLRDLIVVLPFLIFGMTARRSVPIAAIVLIPWAALAVPPVRASTSTVSRGVVAAAIGVVGIVSLLPMLVRPLGVLDDGRFPSEAIVAALDTDGRVFHGDAEGGYLIYAEWPDPLVYFDDRAELYPIEHFDEYEDVRNGRYETAFERWGIDVALSRRGWPLTDVLASDGWPIRAEDEHFVVFERP